MDQGWHEHNGDGSDPDAGGSWMFLTAVAEMVDEDGLSNEEAMAKLLEFLGPRARRYQVRVTLDALEAAMDDELTFRELLGSEQLRLMEYDDENTPD